MAPGLAGEPPPESADGWMYASLTLINEANAIFQQLRLHSPDERENRFGEAATLINVQPKTTANLNTASAIFSDLVVEKNDDDIADASRYLMGRIEQIHRLDPDTSSAAAIYRNLLDDRPGSPFAQRALPKLALIVLFDAQASGNAGLAEITSRAEKLTDSDAASDTHLMLADYYSLIGGDEANALRSLLIAESHGIKRYRFRGNVLIRIAELSNRLGLKEQAAQYYRKFLDSYERDNRRRLVQERMRALTGSES